MEKYREAPRIDYCVKHKANLKTFYVINGRICYNKFKLTLGIITY